MRLSVAANYDLDLAGQLAAFPVEEVYGKFPCDFIGGGRPAYMGTPLSHRELARYIEALSGAGIRFNYLLNAACLGNREWSGRWQRRLPRLLDRLGEMGVQSLTVSTPYLLEAIRRRFPGHFHIRVGIFAQVDTPRRARFWRELGADAITLESFSLNRDFARLRAIRAAVDCDLSLIANHCCLPNCPLQPYHQNGFAHASDGSGGLFIDYCFLACARRRLADPAAFVRSAWIRPEDTARYEALGYSTFKLLERGIPSAELLNRVRAYSERRFDGNLAEILLPYGFDEPLRKQRFWLVRHFLRPFGMRPWRLAGLWELIRRQGMLFPLDRQRVFLDSAAIPPDFLDRFETVCCAEQACESCRYCDGIAEGAVRIEPDLRRDLLARHDRIHDALISGSLWDV